MSRLTFKRINFILLTALILSYSACRKSDVTPQIKTLQSEFFKVPNGQPQMIYQIVEWLKEDDAQNSVVSEIAKEGMPIWEKYTAETRSGGSRIKIPLVSSDTKKVENYLLVQVKNGKVIMDLIRGRFYHRYHQQTIDPKTVITDLMQLNNRVFGATGFLIKDLRLFFPKNVLGVEAIMPVTYLSAQNFAQSRALVDSSVSGGIVSSNSLAAPCNRNVTFNLCTGDMTDTGPWNCTIAKVTYLGTEICNLPPPPIPPAGSDPYSTNSGPYLPTGNPGVTISYPPCPVGMSAAACEAMKVPVTAYITSTTAKEHETPTQQANSPWVYWDKTKSVPGLTVPMQNCPSFSYFISKFPKKQNATTGLWEDKSPQEIALELGGEMLLKYPKDLKNACAIRVSMALNRSGVIIPNIPGQTWKDKNNKNYFFNVPTLFNWLCKTFGDPDVEIDAFQGGPNGTKFPELLRSGSILNRGIYIMKPIDRSSFGATGHASYFGGFDVFNNGGYYGAAERIYLWRLPQP